MHDVLVNRLGGLSLPRKSVVRLTDRPDMTLDVYRGRKTTIQQQQQICSALLWLSKYNIAVPRMGIVFGVVLGWFSLKQYILEEAYCHIEALVRAIS